MKRCSLYRVHKVHGRTDARTGAHTHAHTEPQQRYYIPTATRCAGIIKVRIECRFDGHDLSLDTLIVLPVPRLFKTSMMLKSLCLFSYMQGDKRSPPGVCLLLLQKKGPKHRMFYRYGVSQPIEFLLTFRHKTKD